MRAAYILIPALGVIAIAYRFYSAFLAAKVMTLDDRRVTPAHTQQDGHNFVPTHKWVLFGHHFAAIAGPGPLIGPVLAAAVRVRCPGLIWLVAGVCLAGAVHDMIILWASTRRKGKSLAEIARMEIGPVAGFTAAVAILFIIVIALAGVGLVFINALADSPWGVFTIAVTIPLALFMSLYMYKLRPGKIGEATIIGVIGLSLSVIFGREVATSSWAPYFTFSRIQLVLALGIYGFCRVGAPGVAAARAARLPQRVHEDRHGRSSSSSAIVIVNPVAADAGVHAVRLGRRADRARRAVPVRVHHHRLRRDLGLSLADLTRARRRR